MGRNTNKPYARTAVHGPVRRNGRLNATALSRVYNPTQGSRLNDKYIYSHSARTHHYLTYFRNLYSFLDM